MTLTILETQAFGELTTGVTLLKMEDLELITECKNPMDESLYMREI